MLLLFFTSLKRNVGLLGERELGTVQPEVEDVGPLLRQPGEHRGAVIALHVFD